MPDFLPAPFPDEAEPALVRLTDLLLPAAVLFLLAEALVDFADFVDFGPADFAVTLALFLAAFFALGLDEPSPRAFAIVSIRPGFSAAAAAPPRSDFLSVHSIPQPFRLVTG